MMEKFREWVDSCYVKMTADRKRREDISFRKLGESSISTDEVLAEVSREFRVEKTELCRRTRNSTYRGVAGMLMRKYAGCSQREAAEILGLTTGAAVSYQIAKVRKLMEEDEDLAASIARLAKRLEMARKD